MKRPNLSGVLLLIAIAVLSLVVFFYFASRPSIGTIKESSPAKPNLEASAKKHIAMII